MRGVILLLLLAVAWADEVPRKERIDCFPSPNASKQKCLDLGCPWDDYIDPNDNSVPLCYYPRGVGGYDVTTEGKILTLTKRSDGPTNQYGKDVSPLYFSTASIGATFNIKIGTTDRYEVPIKIPKTKTTSTESFTYEYTKDGPFAFSVRRKSTGTPIWDTSIGGFIFSDTYIQLSSFFPTDKVYGWGENIHQTLKHDFSKYRTWAMLARDEPPTSGGENHKNLYGVHPFYMALEKDGKAHGVLIWNSNPQEVTIGEGPHFVYRTIGGIIDAYFFPGPTPEEVIQQYTTFVGKPFLPAYFALGFQLSRYGYKDLDDMKAAVKRTQDKGIPLDIPYADIDYMQRYKDFTTGSSWSGFPSYAQELHNAGLHLFLIFDPAIQVDYDSYQRAVDMDASFIEWERDDMIQSELNDLYPLTKGKKVMLGVVWPDGHTAFPDFLDPKNNTYDWWSKEFQLYHQQLPFDGIWIDMNEPANFGTNEDNPWYYGSQDHPNIKPLKCPLSGADSKYDTPPYSTWGVYTFGGGSLSTKTACMCGMTTRRTNRVYDTKNLYGLSESMATQRALYESTGKRGAIISRSTFPSTGHFAGHWLGDNTAAWADLQTSVIGAQEFNIFGIPYVGSDICGFLQTTNQELCLRWQQMGAFHPFSRNHNDKAADYQDPGRWDDVARAAKEALLYRYKYLPYLYSLHFEVSIYGGTVIRPIFFEFPQDESTHDLGHQFLWGGGMMIIPVINQGAQSVSAYLPKASWYSLRDDEYGKLYAPGKVEFSAKTTEMIPILGRGGQIIPRQDPATNTVLARKNPFSLLITMEFTSGIAEKSFGKFYWDDGESIAYDFDSYNYYYWEMQFSVTSTAATLTINRIKTASNIQMPNLNQIDVMGYNYQMSGSSVTVNGASVSVTANYDSSNKVLKLTSTNGIFNFANSATFVISWPHSG